MRPNYGAINRISRNRNETPTTQLFRHKRIPEFTYYPHLYKVVDNYKTLTHCQLCLVLGTGKMVSPIPRQHHHVSCIIKEQSELKSDEFAFSNSVDQ